MTTDTCSMIAGLFTDQDIVQGAIQALRVAGFPEERIVLITQRKRAEGDFDSEAEIIVASGSSLTEFTVKGLPSLQTEYAVDQLIDVLAELGISDFEASWFQGEVHAGSSLILVRLDGYITEVSELLLRNGAAEVRTAEVRPATNAC